MSNDQIRVAGRTDTATFFTKAGVLSGTLTDTPLAFVAQGDGVEVKIIDSAKQQHCLP